MKYGNTKVEYDGIRFDSKKEARRYMELTMLERNGDICNLRRQVKYELLPNQYTVNEKGKKKLVERAVAYVADFVYEEDGRTVVEDTKGYRTKEYIIKRKLMMWRYGIRISEL